MNLNEDELPASRLLALIRAGNIEALTDELATDARWATATIVRRCEPEFRYPLINAATDWPGHFPNVDQTLHALVAAGADVNARCQGAHHETPLHGAASSNDILAVETLLALGADIEADGGVIAGGTPLDDAVAFAQWDAAQRLVVAGAHTAVWHAAALGLNDRVDAFFAAGEPPTKHPWGSPDSRAVDLAFWAACHGGQLAVAKGLLSRGADPRWTTPWDGLSPKDAAVRAHAADVVVWLESLPT
ncbi:MAG: ankyrin repeat domain-containing protein [bacterium]